VGEFHSKKLYIPNGKTRRIKSKQIKPNSITMKKFLYFLTGFAIALSIPVFSQTILFKDVDPTAYYIEGLNYLTSANIIQGYADNTFRPSNPVNRAEIVTILKRYHDYKRQEEPLLISNVNFSETSTLNEQTSEKTYKLKAKFYTTKPAQTTFSGGSKQVSNNSLKQNHELELTISVPTDTLPRTFHYTILAAGEENQSASETRDYTFLE